MLASKRLTVRAVFDEVVDLDPAARVRVLDQCCGDDSALRASVMELLEASDSAGRFLADPELPVEPVQAEQLFRSGSRIGPYVVRRVLGEGGFGSVVLAEAAPGELPAGPVSRLFPEDQTPWVAIKVIRPGMDSAQVVARFKEEERALAKMAHPNVARFYQAGQTSNGRPWLAMEYVDGVPVTDYCRSRGLDIADRLRLFLDLCTGVQHAHHKGVIHRDLKPGNVLVTTKLGRPIPKIIDFGIAKAVAGDELRSSLTGDGWSPGTPQYMSPEQALGPGDRIDARADVYGLGVVLYEILVDLPAYEAEVLRAMGEVNARRHIAETEPLAPSRRLVEMARRLPSADTTGHAMRARAEQLVGDLDWIVARAMEKDPARRYATADALADDIRRFLDDEPVVARSPSAITQVRKFARRNKGLVAAAASVALAMVIGLVGTTAGFLQARQDRDLARIATSAAEQNRREAETQRQVAVEKAGLARMEAERAAAGQRYLYELITSLGLGGRDSSAAVRLIDAVVDGADAGSAPVDAEAPLRIGLGDAYLRLGNPAKAEVQYRRALTLENSLAKNAGSSNVAAVQYNLALCIYMQPDARTIRQREEIEQLLRQSIAWYADSASKDSTNWLDASELLGRFLMSEGRYRDARPLLESVRAALAVNAKPQDPRIQSVDALLIELDCDLFRIH